MHIGHSSSARVPQRESPFSRPTLRSPVKLRRFCGVLHYKVPGCIQNLGMCMCTFKVLDGDAPYGVITFASDLYPGSKSDKDIIKGIWAPFHKGL